MSDEDIYSDIVGGEIDSMLALSVVDHGFELRDQIKPKTEFGFCCFLAKHTALRSKSKNWLARNRDNVFEWSDMSNLSLLF